MQSSGFVAKSGIEGWKYVYEKIMELRDENQRHLIILTGLCGSGKSTIAKSWRKQGFGKIKKKEFFLIDSHVVNLDYILFKKRKKVIVNEGDTIEIFDKYIPKKVKFVVYITNAPQKLVKQASMIIKLKIPDITRKDFLFEKRYINNQEKAKLRFAQDTYHLADQILAKHKIELVVSPDDYWKLCKEQDKKGVEAFI